MKCLCCTADVPSGEPGPVCEACQVWCHEWLEEMDLKCVEQCPVGKRIRGEYDAKVGGTGG